MKKIIHTIFLVTTLFALILGLSACGAIKIEDGRVPAEYLEEVKPLLGTYTGEFNKKANKIMVSLDKEGRLILESESDLIRNSCKSQVGNLLEVKFKKKGENAILKRANFNFNPNFCVGAIEGRKLYLDAAFKPGQTPSFYFSILDHVKEYYRCERRCYDNGAGGGVLECNTECRTDYDYIFIRGYFRKTQN